MSVQPPVVDPRDPSAVRAEVIGNLRDNVQGWSETDSRGRPDQASAALISVFTRFCDLVIQRLNRVPEKNLLAFLDLLGLSLQPRQPARAPVTFTLVNDSPVDVVVPASTQVAAPPGPGEKDPVIFETERELTVVAAKLQRLVTTDAKRGMVADHSALLVSSPADGVRVFSGDQLDEHILYIGHADFAKPGLTEIDLKLEAAGGAAVDLPLLRWEAWDGLTWQRLPDPDVPLGDDGRFIFENLFPIRPVEVSGIRTGWVRCSPFDLFPFDSVLPPLRQITARVTIVRQGLVPDAAFTNGQAIDLTRPFFPLGEQPRLGDALYIGSREALGKPLASVEIEFPLMNPTEDGSPPPGLPRVNAHGVELRWEVWTTSGWSLLGITRPETRDSGVVSDDTFAFTKVNSGLVTIHQLPQTVALTAINGVTSYWLRVWMVSGNYGVDAHTAPDGTVVPANFTPPFVMPPDVGYNSESGFTTPEVLAFNTLQFENLGERFARGATGSPFRFLPVQPPALHMAFTLPPVRKAFPQRAISLYFGFEAREYGVPATPLHPEASIVIARQDAPAVHQFTFTNTAAVPVRYQFVGARGGAWGSNYEGPAERILAPGEKVSFSERIFAPPPGDIQVRDIAFVSVTGNGRVYTARVETRTEAAPKLQRRVRWEYWNGKAWTALPVIDATSALTQSGVVEFLGPGDIALATHFGTSGYWVRAFCEPGEEIVEPRVLRILPNTTFAAQTITVRNEVLGSSDSSENQRFRASRSPVLAAAQLEVREQEAWMPWTEVPDLYASGPQDSHYVLDHQTGQVSFGNGVLGRIPPRGAGNIRMARYQTGGGSAGNRAAGTIVQMKTSVPYIDRVSNPEAAAGGFAAENVAALLERGPRTLRHGNRAVTSEDYEDLARLASHEVARTKCVSLRLLDSDPLGRNEVRGAVSLILVPGSTDAKPVPPVELIARVQKFLRTSQAATSALAIVGPLYVRVDVRVEVALKSIEGASQTDVSIRERLAAFLHPLTGGRDGRGWDFGREPRLSDLHAVIGSVPNVDHIRSLGMDQVEELAGVKETKRFLVHSGQHQVALTFVGPE